MGKHTSKCVSWELKRCPSRQIQLFSLGYLSLAYDLYFHVVVILHLVASCFLILDKGRIVFRVFYSLELNPSLTTSSMLTRDYPWQL